MHNTVVPARPFAHYLGAAIRERRQDLKVAQQGIAQRARLGLRHLQRLEGGASNPKLKTLLAVAKALKTNLQTLLDRAEELQLRK